MSKLDNFLKLITNLVSRKLAYLISQPRTGIQQKVFKLKTCPQVLLQAQFEKYGFGIFTTFLLGPLHVV
jgi:hypothetical protein